MSAPLNNEIKTRIQNFSVETVRNLLNIDNKGIAKLCTQVSMMPKKDKQGRTFFTKDDIEILRRMKGLNEQASIKKSYATVPMKSQSVSSKVEKPLQKTTENSSKVAVDRIVTTLSSMENNLTDKISKMIDEKLDGMDEVVVELVRCKTENETLRYKMNELNKEIYNLKNELNAYKSVGLGLYIKNSNNSII